MMDHYHHGGPRVDRARVDRAAEGLAKVICTGKGKVLGIHILGERATELMQELQLAKARGAAAP